MSIARKEPDNMEVERSSPLEKCSFACHLFLFPVGLFYLSWLLVPVDVLATPEVEAYYPNKEYVLHTPVSALFLFLAVPFLYSALNALTVPDLDSLDTVGDIYTKLSSGTRILSKELPSPESTLPEICDLDPSALFWFSRNQESKEPLFSYE